MYTKIAIAITMAATANAVKLTAMPWAPVPIPALRTATSPATPFAGMHGVRPPVPSFMAQFTAKTEAADAKPLKAAPKMSAATIAANAKAVKDANAKALVAKKAEVAKAAAAA